MWCNALNEFLLDYSDGRLTLSAILNKGISLYGSTDEKLTFSSFFEASMCARFERDQTKDETDSDDGIYNAVEKMGDSEDDMEACEEEEVDRKSDLA